MNTSIEKSQVQSQDNSLAIGTTALSQGDPLQLVQPSPVSGIRANALNNGADQCELPGQAGQCGQCLMGARSYWILK
jgi:hypothetical protein